MPVTGTLDGRTLLGSSPAGWEFRAGVQPTIREFDVLPSDAEALVGGGPRPVRLVIDQDAQSLVVDNLYVISAAPGPNPKISRVRVADRRFWWRFQHITRRFNVRRRIGVRRVTTAGGLPQTFPVVDDVAYAPWSLNGTSPWTAQDALKDVLGEVVQAEPSPGSFEVRVSDQSAPVDNLEVYDAGDAALGRVLAYMPETSVRVEASGKVVVYPRLNAGEKRALDATSPEGDGHIEFIKNSRTRPKQIRVLFVPEVEVRFDFTELASKNATVARDKDARFVENVLPVPDFELEVDGVKVAQGTWITFSQALRAWGAAPGIGNLDYEQIRRMMVPFNGLWAPLLLAGATDPDNDWAARISAIQKHFRQTYRINRRWMDRILSWQANRVATIDPTSGQRGPSYAYQDYAWLATQRSMLLDRRAGQDIDYAVNVDGYPADGNIGEGARSPAIVQTVDHDQGIFRVLWEPDPLRVHEMALPSQIENVPNSDLRGGRVAFNAVSRTTRGTPPALAGSHKMSTIVTAIPASPNDDRQLVALLRRPNDIAKYLPAAVRGGLDTAFGPELEIGVAMGTETARLAWVDGRSADIERLFGVQAGQPSVADLVVNLGGQAGVGQRAASLDAIADAVAARIYLSFADRHEGTRAVKLAAAARLDGMIESVLHEIDTSGRAKTTVAMSARDPDVDASAFLPNSVRRILFRLPPGGQAA